MLAEIGGRDRLVMGGLVIFGLLIVLAAVITGRSTTAYVLKTDAKDAAISFAKTLEAASAKQPGQKTLSLQSLDGSQLGAHVSKLSGLAVLSPDRSAIASGGDLDAVVLRALLAQQPVAAAFDDALARQTAASASGEGDSSLVFVPVVENGDTSRVYAFGFDQSAAARFARIALTVITITTSMLIVLGFSIPAAIASRRIRERWLAEDQIRYLALHDSLTGLPNRLQLRQHLDRAIARAKRHDHLLAVFCLDLDRFKNVNDTLGHPTGDALLAEVSARLKESMRETDLVARLGGDEFAVVAEDLDSPDDAMRLAQRICNALGEAYHVNGHDVTTSASVGIALGPLASEGADVLMKNADLALYRAKQDGRNTFRFFEPAMDAALQRRRRLEHELRQALARKELYIDYQPQFDLGSGKLSGYEALVRWWHPVEGDIPPTIFIPIAEETGLIAPLGEWILQTACAYATTWDTQTTLAVNLSPAQFKTQDVVGLVRRVLAETGLEPHRLELEITEGILLHNTETVVDTLTHLDRLGVSIAMDDFGTGYSSLSYLTKFPVRKIKIDRSFIDTLGDNPQTSAIVSSIVGLGQSLNVTITAEGVETEDQAAILRQWGCDQVQGFYYGKPDADVPEGEASKLNRPMVA